MQGEALPDLRSEVLGRHRVGMRAIQGGGAPGRPGGVTAISECSQRTRVGGLG